MPKKQVEPDAPRAEHRWPVLIALAVALTLFGTLPSSFSPWLRLVVVVIGVILVIPLVIQNPVRLTTESTWSRWMSRGLTFLLLFANQVAIIQLIIQLIVDSRSDAPNLLIATVQVWITNVIAFALLGWEFDRGGPISRTTVPRGDLPLADLRFPQDEDHDAVSEVSRRSSIRLNWTPSYVDYLYSSLTNSMAFSPTDAMPLSHRAKLVMGYESFAGFVILALVIGRVVALIGGN
jgi:hypothetical protein